MSSFAPRYDGDTVSQFLNDTQNAPHEGNARGLAKHLAEEHGLIPAHASPKWQDLARQHIDEHRADVLVSAPAGEAASTAAGATSGPSPTERDDRMLREQMAAASLVEVVTLPAHAAEVMVQGIANLYARGYVVVKHAELCEECARQLPPQP